MSGDILGWGNNPLNPRFLTSKNLFPGWIESIRYVNEGWCIGLMLLLGQTVLSAKPVEFSKKTTSEFKKSIQTIIPVLVDHHIESYKPDPSLWNFTVLDDLYRANMAEKEELLNIPRLQG
jgi:hypothetical protein